jgi:hypothetical protein
VLAVAVTEATPLTSVTHRWPRASRRRRSPALEVHRRGRDRALAASRTTTVSGVESLPER